MSLRPNTTMIPNFYLDQVMPLLGEAENKVYLYLCRRIFGFEEHRNIEQARVSLSEIVSGRTSVDGKTIYDLGAGVSRTMASKSLRSLEKYGLAIQVEKSSKGNIWAIQFEIEQIAIESLHERRKQRKEQSRPRMIKASSYRHNAEDGTAVVPPSSTTAVPPSSTTAVPPSSTTAVPPSSTTAVPPSSTTAVPPSSTTAVPPSSTTAVPSGVQPLYPSLYIERNSLETKGERKGERKGETPSFLAPSEGIKLSELPTAKSDEYLPGLPNPKSRQGQSKIAAEGMQIFESYGVPMSEANAIKEKVLAAFGQTALADLDTLESERALNRAVEVSLTLAGLGYTTALAVEALIKKFRAEDWRGRSNGTTNQLLAFASEQKQAASIKAQASPITVEFDQHGWVPSFA